jgi:tetratricopeptide (TPR) repeat protein
MGSLYKYQNNSIKSLEYYNKSLEIRVEINDLNGMAMSYNNIGVVYEIEGNTDLALDYYNRGLKMFIESNDIKNQGITLGNIGSIYLTHGEFEEALEFFNKSLEIHKSISYSRGLANQYQNLGQYYELTGDRKLAIDYTERAYDIYKALSRLEDEKETAADLSNLYKNEGDFQRAFNYLLIFKDLNDRIFDNEKIKNIAQMESEYMHLKEDEIRDLKDQKRRLVNTSIFLALAFISLIGASLYSRLRIKIRQQSLDYIDINLEKRQIETELELKEREMATNAIYLVKKNEIISDVVERLNRAKANLKEENKPVISDIINDLSGSIDKDIWDDFEIRFLNVHNNFYENLQEKFPELTANEKRISAFIRLNMSTKEISSITNQTPHSINIARTRLRKKLGLSNTDTNLSTFLSRF